MAPELRIRPFHLLTILLVATLTDSIRLYGCEPEYLYVQVRAITPCKAIVMDQPPDSYKYDYLFRMCADYFLFDFSIAVSDAARHRPVVPKSPSLYIHSTGIAGFGFSTALSCNQPADTAAIEALNHQATLDFQSIVAVGPPVQRTAYIEQALKHFRQKLLVILKAPDSTFLDEYIYEWPRLFHVKNLTMSMTHDRAEANIHILIRLPPVPGRRGQLWWPWLLPAVMLLVIMILSFVRWARKRIGIREDNIDMVNLRGYPDLLQIRERAPDLVPGRN